LEVLANLVGPDMMGLVKACPLNFRRLQGFRTRRHALVANGYCAGYGEIVDCQKDMHFEYFADPEAFTFLTDEPVDCHFCATRAFCIDGGHLHGIEQIDAVCLDCLAAGRLIDLDISTNQIAPNQIQPDSEREEVSNEIMYRTPLVPTWQDFFWPVKNGVPFKFIKIASKLDYDSREQFLASLFDCEPDPDLWDMLPDHRITNVKEGQYDISFYLFEHSGDKLTIWDAN
jgi:uncharacterized protein CbrC (UPF0167 family)